MTDPTISSHALQASVLVVAHPDDEILWFGSIASKVDRIVICFLNDPVKPALAASRIQTLREHPWKEKIVCLGLDETNSFNSAAWPVPETSIHGLKIVKSRKIGAAYRICYRKLEELLAPIIQKATNVFTHNPWGEYGHEEHVLVHRVSTSLAEEMQKKVWYGNYGSNWSEDLMRLYLDNSVRQVFRAEVDAPALETIAEIYRANDAWTWFDDFKWFEHDCFVQGPLTPNNQPGFGWLFPINMLRLPEREMRSKAHRPSLFRRALKKLRGR